MAALGAAVLSGLAFYISFHPGWLWWLAWIAPVPVLILSFSRAPRWRVWLASFAAYLLGLGNLLPGVFGTSPLSVLAFYFLALPFGFALMIVSTGYIRLRLGNLWSMAGMGALWAGFDYLQSLDGMKALPAALSQAGMPLMIQSEAYLGPYAISFLIGAVGAGLALGFKRRGALPFVLALLLFLANLGLGWWRLHHPTGPTPYATTTDVFAWAALALAVMVNLAAIQTGRRRRV